MVISRGDSLAVTRASFVGEVRPQNLKQRQRLKVGRSAQLPLISQRARGKDGARSGQHRRRAAGSVRNGIAAERERGGTQRKGQGRVRRCCAKDLRRQLKAEQTTPRRAETPLHSRGDAEEVEQPQLQPPPPARIDAPPDPPHSTSFPIQAPRHRIAHHSAPLYLSRSLFSHTQQGPCTLIHSLRCCRMPSLVPPLPTHLLPPPLSSPPLPSVCPSACVRCTALCADVFRRSRARCGDRGGHEERQWGAQGGR